MLLGFDCCCDITSQCDDECVRWQDSFSGSLDANYILGAYGQWSTESGLLKWYNDPKSNLVGVAKRCTSVPADSFAYCEFEIDFVQHEADGEGGDHGEIFMKIEATYQESQIVQLYLSHNALSGYKYWAQATIYDSQHEITGVTPAEGDTIKLVARQTGTSGSYRVIEVEVWINDNLEWTQTTSGDPWLSLEWLSNDQDVYFRLEASDEPLTDGDYTLIKFDNWDSFACDVCIEVDSLIDGPEDRNTAHSDDFSLYTDSNDLFNGLFFSQSGATRVELDATNDKIVGTNTTGHIMRGHAVGRKGYFHGRVDLKLTDASSSFSCKVQIGHIVSNSWLSIGNLTITNTLTQAQLSPGTITSGSNWNSSSGEFGVGDVARIDVEQIGVQNVGGVDKKLLRFKFYLNDVLKATIEGYSSTLDDDNCTVICRAELYPQTTKATDWYSYGGDEWPE